MKHIKDFQSLVAAKAATLYSPLVVNVTDSGTSKMLIKSDGDKEMQIDQSITDINNLSSDNVIEKVTLNYLTFTCTQDGGISLSNYGNNAPNIQYSKNGGAWTNWSYDTNPNIDMKVNDTLKLKGNNPNGISSSNANYSKFVMTGSFAASGDLMTIINDTTEVTTIPGRLCFYDLFKGCTALTTSPVLNASSIMPGDYYELFSGCTALTSITILSTNLPMQYGWLTSVPTTCTINKNSQCTGYSADTNGIPSAFTKITNLACTISSYNSTTPIYVTPAGWDFTTTPIIARINITASLTYNQKAYNIDSIIETVTSNAFSNNTGSEVATKDITYTTHGLTGNATLTQFGHTTVETVDLGLSCLWAKCNLGATTETEYGKYFAWGDTQGYTDASGKFTWPWYRSLPACMISANLTGSNDIASIMLGSEYRMPTRTEFNELKNNTTNSWTPVSSVNGRKFINKNDDSKYIFIPAAGYGDNGSISDVGLVGYCWSSTYLDSNFAYYLYFNLNRLISVYSSRRYLGFSVRPVKNKVTE